MPHTRSAKKQLRKNQKRRLQNRSIKKAIKTQIKRVESAAEGPAGDALQKEFALGQKVWRHAVAAVGLAPRRVKLREGQADAAGRRVELQDALDRPLAEGRLADQRGPAVVLQGPGEHFGGTRRLAVHEDDQRDG